MKPVYIRDDVEPQRQHLSAIGRSVCRHGWLPGMSGSISIRSGEAILITAGDLDKRVMTHQDTVMVDPFDGLPLLGETEWPPDETAIHLALYRRLPGCGAVICAQAPCAEALATVADGSGQALLREPEAAQAVDLSDDCPPVPPVVADRLDASRVAEDVVAALDASTVGTSSVLLVRQNGLVAWGRDADEALGELERIDRLSHLPQVGAVADEPAAVRVNTW
ncbi:class II aldolase/adducin family protein [Streptomyces sp. NPDC005009]